MSNATAAGPSYGILDVLFGTAPAEGEADGKDFGPLMNLIKAMKEKTQEGDKSGRTEEETAPGKNKADGHVAGMPGWMPFMVMAQQVPAAQSAVDAKVQEEVKALMSQRGSSQAQLKPIDLGQVNQLLQEKDLPALQPGEEKLLAQVNQKIRSIPAEDAGPDSMAAPESHPGSILEREVAKRGVDAQALNPQGAVGVNGTPEKFLSTEAYMQMHQRFLKGAKEDEGARMGQVDGNAALPGTETQRPVVAVAGSGAEGKDLFGGRDGEKSMPEVGTKKPVLERSLMAGDFLSALRAEKESSTRDIILPGTKPSEVKAALLGEVNGNVHQLAFKGGGEMRLVIHPEGMGELKLQVGAKGGQVEVKVTASNDDVAQILRGGSQDLENSLRNQNMTLAKFEVNVAAADGPVASLDAKGNLSDQFMQQQSQSNQQGFMQQSMSDSRSFARWDGGGGQGQHSSQSGNEQLVEEQMRSRAPNASIAARTASRDGSRRLDVVA